MDETILIGLLPSLVALGIAIKALSDAHSAKARLSGLLDRVGMLDYRVGRLSEQLAGFLPAPPPSAEIPTPPLPVTPAAAPASDEPMQPVPEPVDAPPFPVANRPPAIRWAQVEAMLVENWLVWLGGAALALGGAFLVKLSIDHGWLIPSVRVALGLALGIGLSVGAEWLRRRDASEPEAEAAPSYVPAALAAAGAAVTFASVYAAYALYDLLPGMLAFVLLAATCGATVAQSLRHGPFVAALGLAGVYVVPLLVASEQPHALPLFAYLAVVTAGALALLRHRGWWWLGWLSLGGATIWVLLWFAAAPDPEAAVVAAYLLVQLALFVAFRRGIARIGFLAGVAQAPHVRVLTRSAFWAITGALLIVAQMDHFGDAGVGATIVAAIGLLWLAYRDPPLDDVIATAGALALLLLAIWNLPLPVAEINLLVFRVGPDHVARFIATALAFAGLLGSGFFLMPRVARPGRWAALSAAAPPAILVLAYWRLQKFDLEVAWTLVALGLAAVELAAAASVAKRRTGDAEIETALGAYGVAVLGCTGIAAAFGLGDAWLTVALALHLPAMGWIDGKIQVKGMRWAALGLASIVVVRLVLNPYALDYPLGPTPIFNWLLYGYGIPTAAFIVATRQFGGRADYWLVWVLEAGSILFSFLLLTLELDHALYGRLSLSPLSDFANGAAMTALWFVYAAGLLILGDRRRRPVLLWGGRLLFGAVTTTALAWQLINLLFGVDVGHLVLFDALLFADAVPAVACAAMAWYCWGRPILGTVTRILAAVFAFAWVTLEIRHAFQGNVALFASSGEGEWYAYSVAWLCFAGTAFGLGLMRRSEWLRRVGLIGIGIVIGKVFLSDMADLSGILRALSFIGLGGALVGLGYAYRKLRPPPDAATSVH